MKVIKFEKTSNVCPSQWEGILKDGRMFYVRYRWGKLRIEVSKEKTKDVFMAIGKTAETLYYEKLGDDYDGILEESILLEKMKHVGFKFDKLC